MTISTGSRRADIYYVTIILLCSLNLYGSLKGEHFWLCFGALIAGYYGNRAYVDGKVTDEGKRTNSGV